MSGNGGGEGVGETEVVAGLVGKLLEGSRERVVLRVEDACRGWFEDRVVRLVLWQMEMYTWLEIYMPYQQQRGPWW